MRRIFAASLLLVSVPLLAPSQGTSDNTPPPGFKALFNGKNTEGWQGAINISKRLKMSPDELAKAQKAANEKIMPHWTVENGVLHNDGQGDNLASIQDFANVELFCDWKIEPKGDSGIYLRGIPQVQIWDSDAPEMKRFPKDIGKGSGSLWNNKANNVPLKKADKSPGEWNRFHIVMKGDKVAVRLNGELVVDDVVLENIWERGKPLPSKGPIELQRHPKMDSSLGKLWFKNIYVKELPE
jgi:hypothetical protein